MTYDEWQANCSFTPEEQEILERFAIQAAEASDALLDTRLRGAMCSTMADMGDAVRELLLLLGDCNLLAHLPDEAFPVYQHIMQRIGTTAHRAMDLVDRSQTFDREALLALMPGHSVVRQ